MLFYLNSGLQNEKRQFSGNVFQNPLAFQKTTRNNQNFQCFPWKTTVGPVEEPTVVRGELQELVVEFHTPHHPLHMPHRETLEMRGGLLEVPLQLRDTSLQPYNLGLKLLVTSKR